MAENIYEITSLVEEALGKLYDAQDLNSLDQIWKKYNSELVMANDHIGRELIGLAYQNMRACFLISHISINPEFQTTPFICEAIAAIQLAVSYTDMLRYDSYPLPEHEVLSLVSLTKRLRNILNTFLASQESADQGLMALPSVLDGILDKLEA